MGKELGSVVGILDGQRSYWRSSKLVKKLGCGRKSPEGPKERQKKLGLGERARQEIRDSRRKGKGDRRWPEELGRQNKLALR